MASSRSNNAATCDGAPGVAHFLTSGFVESFERRHPARVLETLLCDRTTGKNIIWADGEYERLGDGYRGDDEITVGRITGMSSGVIKPRVSKEQERQSQRTKTRAEVFTPSWLVNRMNNLLDREWFRRDGTFNSEAPGGWDTSRDEIRFPRTRGRGWRAYVGSRRLEITCGEAPFVCSRYDTVTGEEIPVEDRIGFLDRKLRVVTERTRTPGDWLKWALAALRATYGFEFQGDNLLIARVNVLETFCEHFRHRWGSEPPEADVERAAWVVSWNLWQMNGFTDAVPTTRAGAPVQSTLFDYEEPSLEPVQLSLFDALGADDVGDGAPPPTDQGGRDAVPLCVIYDWQGEKPFEYVSLKGKACPMEKKFYAVIGNPPYQTDPGEGNTRAQPIYDKFMDACYEVADIVELITPARFLFNAGQTLPSWNEKMLDDPHITVVDYEPDSSKVFANTDIKGGVAVTLRNSRVDYGAIGVFTAFPALNEIIGRVSRATAGKEKLDSIFASQRLYKFSDTFFQENADNDNVQKIMNSGTRTKIVSSFMEKVPDVFLVQAPRDASYIRMLGRIRGQREYRYIDARYVKANEYLDAYKLFIPEANASGAFGERLAEPVVGLPGDGSADTFLNAGPFSSEEEARALAKYYKTKFFRALLGARKVTQHSPQQVWRTIPLQDFTPSSDIDWSKSVSDIDRQLYRKYGLDDGEVEFIETNVKEME